MSATLEDIAEQALRLSRAEKLALANRLLSDDEQEADLIELEKIWEKEILARIEAVDNGTAVSEFRTTK